MFGLDILITDRATMKQILQNTVTALLISGLFTPVFGESARVAGLLDQLAAPDLETWQTVEAEIVTAWRESGSDAIDLLLARGMTAMGDNDIAAAVDHFSAAIDHAPDFAEAYNMRADAFIRQERLGLAMDDLAQVLSREPRHFDAMIKMVFILEQTGENARALAVIREIHSIHPHRGDVKIALERLEKVTEGQKT